MSIVHLPRPIRFLSVILIALLALGVRAPAGVHAAPQATSARWAAIAYSISTGNVGWTRGYPDRDSAQGAALLQCYKHASDCRILTSVQNGYASVAVSRNGRVAAGRWGYTLNEAEQLAIVGCNQIGGVYCKTRFTVSS